MAVAGARKTQSIVDACAGGDPLKRRLVLTYTLTGQRDLERRLRAECEPTAMPDVSGWYSFLLRHWVKPFLPLLYPGRRLGGLNFEGLPLSNERGIVIAKGPERHLDSASRAYKRFLSKLAIEVADAADGTVLTRLQRMYDEIYIDEVQDMTGYDLDVLERLLGTTAKVSMVGDIRQSVFDTNPQDPRLRQFRGLKMLDWFKSHDDAGRLDLSFSSTTYRCKQEIATFSDSIFRDSLDFPPTQSAQTQSSPHDGVFVVAPAQVDAYIDEFNPACLRYWSRTPVPDGVSATNFGVCKGLTHERVLIFPTGPIIDFVTKGKKTRRQVRLLPLRGRNASRVQRCVRRSRCHQIRAPHLGL